MLDVLYLFADTNLLVQCRPLAELDWGRWSDALEVHVVISRPVQTEIDNQKNKGGDRIARRARAASSMLRDIIIEGRDGSVIREASPRVVLMLRPGLKASPEATDRLDYSRTDDEIVGVAHAFKAQHPETDVRVLSHDTGPLGSARMVGLEIAPIPDEWLLPPEPSEADKKIKALEQQVAILKAMEPQISLRCLGADGNRIERLEFTVTEYDALEHHQVAELMRRVTDRFPLTEDFGSREPAERPGSNILGFPSLNEVFEPVTDHAIAKYRAAYEKWRSGCETTMRQLHHALQQADSIPTCVFEGENDGTRPAADVLVSIIAAGAINVMEPPNRRDDEDTEDEGTARELILNKPPQAPQGRWHNYLTSIGAALRTNDFLSSTVGVPTNHAFSEFTRSNTSTRQDPNAFYYKPRRWVQPVEEFSLECRQWRHGVDPELFSVQIYPKGDITEARGTITLEIHAGNMSKPTSLRVPVRIRVEHQSVLEIATRMVDELF